MIGESVDLAAIQAELAEVEAELALQGYCDAAVEHRRIMRQLCDRFEHRLEALTSAYQAAKRLARLSSPQEVLLRLPETLAVGAGFERVLLSTIDGDTLVPLAAHFTISQDPELDADLASDTVTRLRESPVRLTRNLFESDVVRRRRPLLVADAERNPRAARRICEVVGWSAYIVAPIVSRATTLGLIHVDRGPAVTLDVLDRDAVGEFASVVSQLHESADLRRALRQEREAVRRFLDRLGALSISLADTPVTLNGHVEAGASAVAPISVVAAQDADDRLVSSGLLTRRELQVLRLLAEGETNRTIANTLVVSDTTVKFHVNSILKKLHVANRAEAVARYFTLSGLTAPD